MKDTGHITQWGVDCIFVEENNTISILPKDINEFEKLRSHLNDENFLFTYCGVIGHKSTAFIECVRFGLMHDIKFIPKYIIDHCHSDYFAGFDIIGDVIDNFFSPARYFYDRRKSEQDSKVDFIYGNEVAEEWTITFENKPLKISLSYGDILKFGTASDLKLHPKLRIEFERTTDTEFVFRVYLMIKRFFKVICYDTALGNFHVELFDNDNKLSYNGRFRDFTAVPEQYTKKYHEIEYGNFKPYIKKYLQFVADEPSYTFYHYPYNGGRFRGTDYTEIDFINIFSAFESECHSNSTLYEDVDTSKIQNIKGAVLEKISSIERGGLEQEELDFLGNATNRISQLGTQYGQSKKIINAYNILHKAIDSSIKRILWRLPAKFEGHLQDADIKSISNFLASKRGKIAHGGPYGMFSDSEAQKIRFLEILTYCMLLKRIGLSDNDIERVIGVVFGCNFIVFNEKY